jgi:hypothetical protein
VPELDQAGVGQDAERQRLEHHHDLGAQQEFALREAVGDDAAEQPQQQHRQGLEHRDGSERQRRVGQAQDQPGLGDRLHPGAGVGDDLPRPEETKIAVMERAKRSSHSSAQPTPFR